jgi:hypothetical protein
MPREEKPQEKHLKVAILGRCELLKVEVPKLKHWSAQKSADWLDGHRLPRTSTVRVLLCSLIGSLHLGFRAHTQMLFWRAAVWRHFFVALSHTRVFCVQGGGARAPGGGKSAAAAVRLCSH